MLQYLLNLTGIWLLSLIVFDIFLRKESYHTYNRVYLLVTMTAGIAFPLVRWQPTASRLYTAVERPVGTVLSAKGNIVAAAESANAVKWEQWLMVLYAIGAAVMTGLLVRDIVKLAGYYRSGRRSAIEGWTLVETGRGHTPFSFLNLLFVSDRNDYSGEEWQMLVEHEGRHTGLVHIADLVLLQLSRIALWFHPLVYVYNQRLLMVHEYQADKVAAQQSSIYGRFLAEQAILHSAPAITHSFNRSPIKKRILMLTRKSSSRAKSKMLVLLPLGFVFILCFSESVFSQKAETNKIPLVTLGNNGGLTGHTSSEEILADPVLRCKDPNYEFVSYSVSVLCTDMEKDPYRGPYSMRGNKLSGQLPQPIIDLIKEHKGNKGRIFIEDIHIKVNGTDVKVEPIVLRYDN